MLASCIACFVVHGFLPDYMFSTALVGLPNIKDKTSRIDRMDNNIALASVIISTVVEIIILNRISKLLITCSNQFGFQQKHGTDTCIYILKEIVEKCRSPVPENKV